MNNYCENCQCDSCIKQLKLVELQKQFEELKKQMDEISKSMGLNCPTCGNFMWNLFQFILILKFHGVPYPVTPGWQWQWPTITIAGTVVNDLDKAVNINTFPPNWINGDGGSII